MNWMKTHPHLVYSILKFSINFFRFKIVIMKNIQILAVPLFIIYAAFAVVSILVALSGGKNKFLISKKLQIGAIIIGMTCMVNGCRTPEVSCYKVAVSNVKPSITCIDSVNSEGYIILNNKDRKIEFDCTSLSNDDMSFRIYIEDDDIYSEDCELIREDGNIIRLIINFKSSLGIGDFSLRLYTVNSDILDNETKPFKTFILRVID